VDLLLSCALTQIHTTLLLTSVSFAMRLERVDQLSKKFILSVLLCRTETLISSKEKE